MVSSFSSISSDEKDYFSFDFSNEIGESGAIESAVWFCTVSHYSTVPDPDSIDRILDIPTFADTKTTAFIGTCIDGVIYTLKAVVTLDDNRVLSQEADLACIDRPSIEDPIFTIEQFRAQFSAFADPNKYSDDTIAYWISFVTATSPIDEIRWGQFYELGLRLYVAHHLAINAATTASGSPLGPLIATSKSVNGVSVGYSPEFGAEQGGGFWNLSVYGTEFLRYLKMAGAGPFQM